MVESRMSGDCVDRVLAAVRSGRSRTTVSRYQLVERFAIFLAGRGLAVASEQVCVASSPSRPGPWLGGLRERVGDKDVQAVRRPGAGWLRRWPAG